MSKISSVAQFKALLFCLYVSFPVDLLRVNCTYNEEQIGHNEKKMDVPI